MEIIHCADDRAKRQRATIETADGKFKYLLLMDYAQDLPEELEDVPYAGNVSGGCVDKDDNLYVGLRGGSFMDPEPRTCLIKLDPDGHYLGTIGAGTLGGLHFFECTDHDTIVFADTGNSRGFEMTIDGTDKITRIFGSNNGHCDNKRQLAHTLIQTRLHAGIFPTEPFAALNFDDSYAWKLAYDKAELGGPFHNPTDVDMDSEGNYYFSDGYGNCAVQKFDKDGNYVATFGGKGVFDAETDTPGKFLVPHSLCVDPRDHIWVCDRDKDALHILDKDGNVIGYYSHNLGQPSGVDDDGTYVYVAGRGGYITIFDLDMNVVGKIGFFNCNLRAHHLAADSKGNLYLFPTHANYDHQIIALKRI